jgi:hypothetical protein
LHPKGIIQALRERGWAEVLGCSLTFALLTVVIIFLCTHVLAPRLFAHYEHFPALASIPHRTTNAKQSDADPVNVAIVGSVTEIMHAFRNANWAIADSVTRATSIAIAKSVLLNTSDSTAPVSPQFLFGRRQDVAFEQEVGQSARRRHHVRFWRAPGLTFGGRAVWIGAATFDLRAGLSHRGLHPTHHIAPDVDEERDAVEAALARDGNVAATFRVTGLGIRVNAHNADGDRFDTDGELRVIVLSPDGAKHPPPADPGVPPLVALKDRWWAWTHNHRVLGVYTAPNAAETR